MTNWIPEGYPRLMPYLIVDDAAAAIDFYSRVLGATERMRLPARNDRIGHAEISVGDAVIMLADEHPDMGAVSPKSAGGTPVTIHLYVEDVDAAFKRAIDAGGQARREPEDRFYGDRAAEFADPFGHRWSIATHVEDVPPDEMEKRAAAVMGGWP